MPKKIKIVCFGGGNGMPKAVLSDLKNHNNVEITAVCAMLDSGGSAGRLREDYEITSPGDIRRAFIALANVSPAIGELFNYRFQAGELKGHNFANLFITALELSSKNYKKTLLEMTKVLNINPDHKVLPVTLTKSHLFAELEDGQIISGETNIDIPKHDGKIKIKRVFLDPPAKAYKPVIDSIKQADLIIIGPGDIYSSIAQILLVQGVNNAIKQSKAKKIYVCNLMTKYGETNNFSVVDFFKEVEKLMKSDLDYVIYNNRKINQLRVSNYKKKHPELMDQTLLDGIQNYGKKMIGSDVITENGPIIHDSKKLVKIILSICKQ
ncbi:MAG TPA: uridine diphosphate-N-acetylglucosamine-binding protein YvcK [Candidatus Pacearchaeota archaeon]|nr:uridine diphosphate-N-acetylglucosamine-binding protein YvcK [Candidatus Pacearchaeota archaeon]HOU45545.1 uridine diphosphate-N-acetylglucosamine-binding protein YvcK [Candidatus Pacearchaeota archaeon]HPM08758.1 uridine diphosphate-N-acetylglucosamine-binding protein YvcK [Candidatus Pacearchaeota archaeon]HQI74297.1 uridine diphosphate-N-acetylglucosamine-binding protein YvcK [Candidatus Pacearchaeota archaeon]